VGQRVNAIRTSLEPGGICCIITATERWMAMDTEEASLIPLLVVVNRGLARRCERDPAALPDR
jgi:hypothetical protein